MEQIRLAFIALAAIAAVTLALITIFDPSDGLSHDLGWWGLFSAGLGLFATTEFVRRETGGS